MTDFSRTEAYIGIDPGKSGGIACFYNDDDVVRVSKCPDTPEGMYTIYGILTHGYDKIYAYIEHVWGFPSDSSKTAFIFGLNYGCWKTILEISDCQYDTVNPRAWQKHFQTPKMEKRERKQWLKKLAAESAASLEVNGSRTNNVTFNTADALLIAKYCKDIKYRGYNEKTTPKHISKKGNRK